MVLRSAHRLESSCASWAAWGDLFVKDKGGKGRGGWAPLLYAAEKGYEEVVRKKLLERGAAVDAKDNDGRMPLSRAVEEGHEAIVKLLLDTGKVDVEAKDRDGRTALSWDALYGHEAVVKLLRSIK
ncbi:ankyrin [Parathielavia appendiculata]|uniref:Ankyrin n=1 Tax=Parathielavia appendiculata TaxID=2587402 RepID=A0AAN6UB06_9PEZI|nr:ankyrin [Parathielavia appendiculata]